jgi:membrane protease YdiL (CAAX protease family)
MDLPAPVRRGEIATFLLLTLGLSTIFYLIVLRAGTLAVGGGMLVAGLMWCPGIAAMATTAWFRRSLRGLGWGIGPWRFWLWGYMSPVVYAGVVYVLVWIVGLGAIEPEAADRLLSPRIWKLIPGTLIGSVFALGEEIGWRGFLTPRLHARYGFVRSSLLTGAIWAVWHYPLLLGADYNAGTPWWYGLSCFTIMVIGVSFLFAWLRLASGSVWPAMLLHASHNLWIQGVFDSLTADTGPTEWWIGEFGAGLALVAIPVALVALYLRKRSPLPA